MVQIQFSLNGADELNKALKEVSEDVKKKSGRFALRKAANVVASALRVGAQRMDDPATGRTNCSEVIAGRWNTTPKCQIFSRSSLTTISRGSIA